MKITCNAIKDRFSCRIFISDKIVSDEEIQCILQAASMAPSGKNTQPWRFKTINEPYIMAEIASLLKNNSWVTRVNRAIAVFLDKQSCYDEKKDYMAIGACIENMLIEAQCHNINTCWIGECTDYDKEIRNLLSVSDQYMIMAIVCLGFGVKNKTSPKCNVDKLISFVTKLRKHCYYGNMTNILNYYGENTSEAELVLLSNALNCHLIFDTNLYFEMPIELCEQGLEKIGYRIYKIGNEYSTYKSLLANSTPILLLIYTSVLTHNNIYSGSNRGHSIVLLKDNDDTIEISDSFVRTRPTSIFHGNTDAKILFNEITAVRASGIYLEKYEKQNKEQHLTKSLIDYIKTNAMLTSISVVNNLKKWRDIALKNTDELFDKESLNDLAYDIKTSGIVTRLDYLIDLFKKYLNAYPTERLEKIKSNWDLTANKIMKCSITLNKGYYLKVFEEEIPELINEELSFYQEQYEHLKKDGISEQN